ncbi:MAG: hypothetical protein ABEI52_04425 [Halobacteriaceae archaeon]
MEEITDTDTDGRNDDQKVPRREVLSNMGWLGALLAGLTQISTTEATSITEEVTQVADKVVRKTGDERQATLDRALDDDDVEAFRDRFQEEGKQPLSSRRSSFPFVTQPARKRRRL